jgi:hypothetical protein
LQLEPYFGEPGPSAIIAEHVEARVQSSVSYDNTKSTDSMKIRGWERNINSAV